MKVFREDTRLRAPRHGEDPSDPQTWTGWLHIPKGSSPDEFGLNSDHPEVAPYLVNDECAALEPPTVKKGAQPVDLMEAQEIVAEMIEKHGYNPPDKMTKKKLAEKLEELRAAQGGETHGS